jgi:hypothetical protein
MKRRVYWALASVLTLAVGGFARFVGPQMAPIDRLIANTTAFIKEQPTDPMGPYTLARIHYLALATRSAQLRAFEQRTPPSVDDQFRRIVPSAGTTGGAWTEEQLRGHLSESVQNYRQALEMDATNALFHLGLASVSEAALTSGLKPGAIPGSNAPAPKDGDFTSLWREQAIAEYLKAHELAVTTDLAVRNMPLQGINYLISYEAGQQYVALVKARGLKENEQPTLTKVQASLSTLSSKPRGAVTPIIFSLDQPRSLDDLLDTRKTVTFNLDGTGRPQRYVWVQPDTAILVWDPDNSGQIRSGHQLFGSVSFNMFWSDGYRALDALDDNRDGVVSGKELQGLGIWHDRNQDGVSQSGEVVPIGKTAITSISARAVTSVGVSLANPAGLETDGRVLPTYDWTTESMTYKPVS